ncbi:ABC transporter ATP-binding protein [Paenibacillus caui]|uniref:ABC transporter ATP-binding protein n=1 Tax=Paenibacillus caui TaxID=2873927 RepID=UPI001CA8EC18|nr:ABC transporter ATP-binding protein [Paenibacillus caui]
MTGELAVQLRGVTKEGRRKPIGPIDLDIPAGYVVALVGPNGAGKSTLMHLMLKTLQQDEGQVEWFGKQYERGLPVEVQRKIAYVPEVPIYEENYLTAEKAGEFRSKWYPAWDAGRFEELLNRFGVPRGIRLAKMSKGERRKFEISAALACRPKLLLLDEPSSGLDPFAWKEMIESLRTLLEEEGITIILSTHIVEEVKRLADYIVLVYQGQVHGMVEKDMLLGCFQEWWIRGGAEEAARLKGLSSESGPGMMRIMVGCPEETESIAAREGIEVLRKRSLELEEALDLWMKGHLPEQLKWKRGI